MNNLDQLVRKLDDAYRQYQSHVSSMESLQQQIGQFVILNKNVEGIDMSGYTTRAEEIQEDVDFYRGEVDRIKTEITTALGRYSVA